MTYVNSRDAEQRRLIAECLALASGRPVPFHSFLDDEDIQVLNDEQRSVA